MQTPRPRSSIPVATSVPPGSDESSDARTRVFMHARYSRQLAYDEVLRGAHEANPEQPEWTQHLPAPSFLARSSRRQPLSRLQDAIALPEPLALADESVR